MLEQIWIRSTTRWQQQQQPGHIIERVTPLKIQGWLFAPILCTIMHLCVLCLVCVLKRICQHPRVCRPGGGGRWRGGGNGTMADYPKLVSFRYSSSPHGSQKKWKCMTNLNLDDWYSAVQLVLKKAEKIYFLHGTIHNLRRFKGGLGTSKKAIWVDFKYIMSRRRRVLKLE